MNPAGLLAHFDRISDAPDAIPRLRRFILDLAVRGKLVDQDPRDEPASELLTRIQKEKEWLVKAGKLKLLEPVLELSDREMPFSTPSSWAWTRLANISRKIHYGFTASANQSLKSVRLLRITDIQNNSVDWLSVPGCEITAEEVAQYRLDENDIVIARTGGTIGKTFLVRHIPVTAVFASYLIRVQPSAELRAQYLKVFLESSVYWEQLQDGARGGGQPNVNGQTLGRMIVPIPPLAEQHRIVAKVNELMELCDRLEAAQTERESRRDRLVASSLYQLNNGADPDAFRNHARFYFNHLPRLTTRLEHIQQLRQTILSLAVRGKLVHQDPCDEPVAQLLTHTRSEISPPLNSRKQVLGQSAANRSIELPYEIPIQWSWIRLGDLLPEFQNGVSSRGEAKGMPTIVLRLADIKDGEICLADTREMLLPGNATSKYKLENGDTLIVRVNGSADIVGRFVACCETLSAIYCDHFIRMRIRPSWANPKFLGVLGDSPLIREQIGSLFITTAGQKTVNQGHISALLIPLPPLAEQHRIVAKVDELMALCDQLEAQLTITQTESRRLLEAVLHEALAPAV